MDEKQDKTTVRNNEMPPRGRKITELVPILSEHKKPSSSKVSLMGKKKYQTFLMESPRYFFKQHDEQSRVAELEAYCGSICQFLATSEYVPNTRPYFDNKGKPLGITSKAISGFRSNYEQPLQLSDLLINSPGIHREFRERSIRLITENLLHYYTEQCSITQRLKRYLCWNTPSWFDTAPSEHSIRTSLKQLIDNKGQCSLDSLLSTLNQRRNSLRQVFDSTESRHEFYLLNQVIRELTALNKIGDIDVPVEMSIVLWEKLHKKIKAKGINLDLCGDYLYEEIDGSHYKVATQYLKNYRILRGQGVALSTQLIFKEGDGHNSNRSKEGPFVDFDWTKINILFDFKKQSAFNQLLRHPKEASFACTEYNIEHFPDINDPNLFYWPTKQPEMREVFLASIARILSYLEEELLTNNSLFKIIPAQLILDIFNTIDVKYSVNKTYPEIVNGFFQKIYLEINTWSSSQSKEEVIVKEKIKHLVVLIQKNIKQVADLIYMDEDPLDVRKISKFIFTLDEHVRLFFGHYQNLRTALKKHVQGDLFKSTFGIYLSKSDDGSLSEGDDSLEAMFGICDIFFNFLKTNFDLLIIDFKKRYQHFEGNAYTVEDNTTFKLLAGHPVFIFHKYKTCLKYVLTDPDVYQILAELNIAKKSDSSSNNDSLHEILVVDEEQRIKEIRQTLIKMPDFKLFLKEYGQFAFELIKEELQEEREKYGKKTKHQSYYQRLVHALDSEMIEDKFNELYLECKVAVEDNLQQEDDESVLCI